MGEYSLKTEKDDGKKTPHKSTLITTSQTPQDASVKSQLSLNVTAWLHWKMAAGRMGSNKAKTDGGQERRKGQKGEKKIALNEEKMAREELRSSGERKRMRGTRR